jgi:phospholipid/cholesterol/gamma-HCH transport system substrate-binding protein
LPIIQSEPNPLAEIFSGGAEMLETANSTLENIGEALSDKNVASFTGTLENLNTITTAIADDADLVGDVSATLASIRQASDDFAAASRSVTVLSQNTDAQINVLATDAARMLTDLRNTMARVDQLIETTNGTVAQTSAVIDPAVEAMEEFRLASQDLRLLIQRLDGFARDVEENPQAFIAGDPKPYEGGRR